MEDQLHLEDATGATGRSARGLVLLLHGGAERSARPVTARSLTVRRTRWMLEAMRRQMQAEAALLGLLRFRVKGWNADAGPMPAPVGDLRAALEGIRRSHPGLPVVLVGHSMGARTAAWAADEPNVVGVVGLAPWFPADDPVAPLSGVHLVAAHGRRDRITSPKATRRFVERAEAHAASARYRDMGPRGHYMLTGVAAWNEVATRSALEILDRVAGVPLPE